jgi:hypothetical protein
MDNHTPISPERVVHAPTFVTEIGVPLLQNLIGGAAVAGLVAVLALALSRWQSQPLDNGALSTWCWLVGGAVACMATVVRFFGDDMGLLQAAYRAGQHNMQLRVNALELELQAARTQLSRLLEKSNALPPTRATQEMQRIYKAAQHLIHWHFEQLPIDRRSCEQRNMSQGDWRRARHLLIAAGVMDEQGVTAHTLPEALTRVQARYQKVVSLGGHAENFVVPQ